MNETRPTAGETRDADRPALAITLGDPCGIGPEIVLKALANEKAAAAARLIVIGDEGCMRRAARDLKLRWPFGAVLQEPPTSRRWEKPQLLDLGNVEDGLRPGQVSAAAGRAAGEDVEFAARMALSGAVDGVVTAPLNKESLQLAGFPDPGHTEMLARIAGVKKVAMLFWSEELSVALLTTHVSMRDALAKVTRARVLAQLELLDAEWRRFFGKRPRIGVAALNPHAGEGNRFGHEETREIIPAIGAAAAKGLAVYGPVSADAIFIQARRGDFDVVLALYHDQATIPIKLLTGRRAVNVTVGLPFVRTSVDHGTAMDIAGKGVASEESMVQAIVVGATLARALRNGGGAKAARGPSGL